MSQTRFGLVIIGGCGNTGSFAAQLTARLPGVRKILLVDKDRYEKENLVSQCISRDDVGKPKVEAMARRLLQINPELEVDTFFGEIENLPVGLLLNGNNGNTTILLGCVDSRGARLYLSETSFSTGIVYIDAGVKPDGLLARVNVYIPGRDEPCMQCGWQQADYDAISQTYACGGSAATAEAPTNGLAPLGALAASLQVLECHKILSGRPGRVLKGSELLIDAAWHRHYVSTQRRNPECRFPHVVWRLENLDQGPSKLTLAKVFSLADPDHSGRAGMDLREQHRACQLSLMVPGHRFARMLSCPDCGCRQRVLALVRRLQSADRACANCGTQMEVLPGDLLESLEAGELPGPELSRTLKSLGLESGDVIKLERSREGSIWERYYMIGPEQTRKSRAKAEGVQSVAAVNSCTEVAQPSAQAR